MTYVQSLLWCWVVVSIYRSELEELLSFEDELIRGSVDSVDIDDESPDRSSPVGDDLAAAAAAAAAVSVAAAPSPLVAPGGDDGDVDLIRTEQYNTEANNLIPTTTAQRDILPPPPHEGQESESLALRNPLLASSRHELSLQMTESGTTEILLRLKKRLLSMQDKLEEDTWLLTRFILLILFVFLCFLIQATWCLFEDAKQKEDAWSDYTDWYMFFQFLLYGMNTCVLLYPITKVNNGTCVRAKCSRFVLLRFSNFPEKSNFS